MQMAFLKNVKKSSGFSLVEMMLVIVIISIIAMYAANIAKERAQATLAATTAAEMQLWLQASLNYHAKTQNWPQASGATNSGFTNLNNDNLLPASAECSQILIQNASNTTCGAYSPFYLSYAPNTTYKNSPYILVNLLIPNQALGTAIAAKLPAGSYINSIVSATAVLPGGLSAVPYYFNIAETMGVTADCSAASNSVGGYNQQKNGCVILQAALSDNFNGNLRILTQNTCAINPGSSNPGGLWLNGCSGTITQTISSLQQSYPGTPS